MKSVVSKKAFTVVELMVAMALIAILMALSSLIFATAVRAHRTADSTLEITRRAEAICRQLSADFRGLQKDGEIFLVWVASPALNKDGVQIAPLQYQKFDRIVFFADGDFQTYNPQPTRAAGVTKPLTGNLARISYVPAKDGNSVRAAYQPDRKKRILSRTQHLVTADSDFLDFPDFSAAWDPDDFERKNFFDYEYQTMTMAEWTNLSNPAHPNVAAKNNILTILSDIQNILFVDGSVIEGGPTVDSQDSDTYHNYFCEGVGEFGIQIWLKNQQRWFPQLDPDQDGNYTDSDYPTVGSVIHPSQVDGVLYDGTGEGNLKTAYNGISLEFTALKFTFTVHDTKGLFPDGRTFTHIVMIED